MSPWWPERITVWLAPHKGQDVAACFAHQLDALAPRPRAQVSCVLGGPQVRCRIVPWSDALSSPHQRQVLAASCFHETYGAVSRGWLVRDHVVRHGVAGLACAIDAAWPQVLGDVAKARGLQLVGLQPSLVHVHNTVRGQLVAGMCWLVWEEAAVTTLVLWRNGEPLHLKVLPSAPVQLATLLDREWFLAAVDAPRCPVVLVRAAGQGRLLVRDAGWQVTELPAQGPVHALPETEATA